MKESALINLIVLAPLIGAGILGVVTLLTAHREKGASEGFIGSLGVIGPLLSFMLTVFFLLPMGNQPKLIWHAHLLDWIMTGDIQIRLAFTLDRLAGMMVLMITLIGTLIHVFSIAYMKGDRSFARYFCYLNLFFSAMLVLVMSDNIVGMFLGWEGVGLCSYLLIGFWFTDIQKAAAGTKAFIVNRVGDFGFILGIFFIFIHLGTFEFVIMESQADLLTGAALTLVTLLLFVGAMGKSAQIPLHIWLPDAMAGPTPVSALIHAATMVTAGVYMIVRLHFFYEGSPTVSFIIILVGVATAFMAASIALVQEDIKKVLAYSTISQLGYMFMAVGAGAYAAGIFHLFTHAFFKAALFLGAGAVIYCSHHEQNLWNMGGLRKYLPVTGFTMLVSTLAISGIPPFAGFFSKDEILWALWSEKHYVVWAIGVITAGLTAFYMFRLFFLAFVGARRSDSDIQSEPLLMKVPLLLLAIGAILTGFLGLPEALGTTNWFVQWLTPTLGHHEATQGQMLTAIILMLVSVGAAVAGIVTAYMRYVRETPQPTTRPSLLRAILQAKYGFDTLYELGVVVSLKKLGQFLWHVVDDLLLDGLVKAVPWVYKGLAQGVSLLQFGNVRAYAYYLMIGFMLIGSYYLIALGPF